MHTLEIQEIDGVSGGWDVTVNLGIIKFDFSGNEAMAAYNWAVSETSDFFTWWDPMGYYDRC